MKRARGFAVLLALAAFAQPACAFVTPTQPATPAEPATAAAPNNEPSPAASLAPSAEPSAAPTAEPALPTPTAAPAPTLAPTAAPLALEVLQTQTWADSHGDIRTNVLVRNPYAFPVASAPGSTAYVLNGAGEVLDQGNILFLDGISGGSGYLLPGETIAANICYTCEEVLPAEPWEAVELAFIIEDATGRFNVSTDVEATDATVSFDGDSPIFWVSGTVKNHSEAAIQRISMRFFVFDGAGGLVGAAEASAWDVGPGATASVNGYGLGQTPDSAFVVEVSALGVNYQP